jgi:hypothetical protein
MLDRPQQAHTAFVMGATVITLVMVPIAAVSATAIALPPPTLAIIVALSALTSAAVCLLVMESQAELSSRAAWDAIGATPPAMLLPGKPGDLARQYPAAVHDQALHDVLRAHRQAYPRQGIGLAAETGWGNDIAPQDAAAVAARVPLTTPACEVSGSCNAESFQNDANDIHTGLAVVRSCAPTKSASRSKLSLGRSSPLGTRFRRVVNASADTPGRGSRLRVIGIPIKIVSDIIVLGQGKKEPINSDSSRKVHLDGGRSESQLRTSGRIRLRRSPNTAVDEAAIAEARRKVMALAEALARRAACEDDAAEQARERSSAEDVAMSSSPSDNKEETG